MSRRNKLLIAFLVFTMAALACGGNPQIESENATLEAELRTLGPVVATEAAALPQTVVEAAGQAALDNSMTLGDLLWEDILGVMPCRDPRPVRLDTAAFILDDWAADEYPANGWGVINGVQCGPPTPAEAREEFLYDLGTAGIAIATPLPGDEVFFLAKVGKSLIVVVGVGALAILADNGLTALASSHTNDEHNPYKKGSVAEAIVLDFVARWPNGPDNQDWICATIYTIRAGVKLLARTVFWNKTGTGYGDLAWYNHLTGRWGGAYGYKLQETVTKLPKSLQDSKEQYTIESGCGGGPMPPLAATN